MKQRNAFSLMEVLLVLAIIGVVTAIGLSISNKGMEKAYREFWYTGYSTLLDITNDAIRNEKFDLSNPVLCASYNATNGYAGYIVSLIQADTNNFSCENDANGILTATFTAPNGINYVITDNRPTGYKIQMTIPHPNSPDARYISNFVYNFNGARIRVYPSNVLPSDDPPYVNLHDRPDLLPFYVQIKDSNVAKEFYGFRTAYCRRYSTGISTTNSAYDITCNAGEQVSNARHKIIPVSPRKAY